MGFSLSNWNVNPNRLWFLRLYDGSTGIGAGLYLTLADAQAQTNRQAYGTSAAFGTDQPVSLRIDNGATVSISKYQDVYSWHLVASGQSGDAAKIFQIKAFVDLSEISDPIYRNEEIIPWRAAAEINAHTHAKIERDVTLASHLPELAPGQIVQIDSDRMGDSPLGQVTEHRIAGEPNKLTSTLTVTSYLALKR